MDMNDVRVAVTVASFLVFLGILLWVFLGPKRREIEQMGALPFFDADARPPQSLKHSTGATGTASQTQGGRGHE
jgi:hypothetical protein